MQRRCGIEYGEHLRTQRGAVVVALGEHTPLRLRCQYEAYFTPGNETPPERLIRRCHAKPAIVARYFEGGLGFALSSPWDLGYGRSA